MSALVTFSFLFGFTAGMSACYWVGVRPLWSDRKRAYEYAVERADFTEAGRAYSDMATVITLGRAAKSHGHRTETR